MKRTKEPTTLARMFRQFKGISSEMAMKLADNILRIGLDGICAWSEGNTWLLYDEIREIIIDTIGRKKDGTPKKLALDLIRFLEEGK